MSTDEQRSLTAEHADLCLRNSLQDLQDYAATELQGRALFHWPIQFAEVFARGGFDAFVGNPPFMGGQLITAALGEKVPEPPCVSNCSQPNRKRRSLQLLLPSRFLVVARRRSASLVAPPTRLLKASGNRSALNRSLFTAPRFVRQLRRCAGLARRRWPSQSSGWIEDAGLATWCSTACPCQRFQAAFLTRCQLLSSPINC